MSIHHLKILRKPFEDLVSGRKTGEVRNCADRDFREGDQVELFLIDEAGNPANKSIVRTITHIQRGFGLPDDICVLSYAAPVVERQEPVAVVKVWTVDPWYPNPGIHKSVEVLKDLPDGTKLYTSPPVPVSVVLPERILGQFHDDPIAEGQAYGWNACLDKVKELNQ